MPFSQLCSFSLSLSRVWLVCTGLLVGRECGVSCLGGPGRGRELIAPLPCGGTVEDGVVAPDAV